MGGQLPDPNDFGVGMNQWVQQYRAASSCFRLLDFLRKFNRDSIILHFPENHVVGSRTARNLSTGSTPDQRLDESKYALGTV